jgi:hypothetical protein
MSNLLTQHVEFSSQTIVVTNTAELNNALDALSTGNGGTILLDGNGGPYDVNVDQSGMTGKPVLLQSMDTNNPAVIENMSLMNASYLSFNDLVVDSQSQQGYFDVEIKHSDNIQFSNMDMVGDATGYLGAGSSAAKAESGILIKDSDNILIADSELSHYYHGLSMQNVTNVQVVGNEIHSMQGDGIRGGGWQNMVISQNHIHDFLGSDHTINHDDMIQMWSVSTNGIPNIGVEISSNFLDAGQGAATQSILLQAEAFNMAGHPLQGVYNQDIKVFDNLIYNGQYHGISVAQADNAQVYGNTVLWNTDAQMVGTNGTAASNMPWIKLSGTINSTVHDNIAGKITENGQALTSNNAVLDYQNASDPNFAYTLFPGLANGDLASFSDLQLSQASSYYGVMGADSSVFDYLFGAATTTPAPAPAPAPDTTSGTTPDTGLTSGPTSDGPTSDGSASNASLTSQAQEDPSAPGNSGSTGQSDTASTGGGSLLSSLFNAIANLFKSIFGGGGGNNAAVDTPSQVGNTLEITANDYASLMLPVSDADMDVDTDEEDDPMADGLAWA